MAGLGSCCPERYAPGAVFDPFLDALGVPGPARHVIDLDSPQIEDYPTRLAALSHGKAVICGFFFGCDRCGAYGRQDRGGRMHVSSG